jgi:hypothetical protein
MRVSGIEPCLLAVEYAIAGVESIGVEDNVIGAGIKCADTARAGSRCHQARKTIHPNMSGQRMFAPQRWIFSPRSSQISPHNGNDRGNTASGCG